MNIQMINQKLLKQLPGELEHELKVRFNQRCTLDDIANTLKYVRKRKNKGKYSSNEGSNHYSNNLTNENKKIYSIEQFPEEGIKAEDSESDSMSDSMRENFDDEQDQQRCS
ncbi:hypothetical protein O181_026178 [Austropuccinia psidii MF-1]|uniref:Uncharacterized protein n=1 Tax=Austropuccinia psidii MF-1 TaxID=1389203 RepID=A0A9Q3CP99_9BASI|nr:hypothetical protein [Austropuccinia psidii MF-1]